MSSTSYRNIDFRSVHQSTLLDENGDHVTCRMTSRGRRRSDSIEVNLLRTICLCIVAMQGRGFLSRSTSDVRSACVSIVTCQALQKFWTLQTRSSVLSSNCSACQRSKRHTQYARDSTNYSQGHMRAPRSTAALRLMSLGTALQHPSTLTRPLGYGVRHG